MAKLLLREGWDVQKNGWPTYVCLSGKGLAILMREDNKGYIVKMMEQGLTCYKKKGENYQVIK